MSPEKLGSEQLVKLVQGRASPEESEHWLGAIEADSGLSREYEDLCETGRALDELMAQEPAPSQSVAEPVLERIPVRSRTGWAVPIATATVCMLVTFILMRGNLPVFGPSAPTTPVAVATKSHSGFGGRAGVTIYHDERVANSVNAAMTYVEGTLGALIMLVAGGLATVVFVMWAKKRSGQLLYLWVILLAIATTAFLLRMLMSTFFNDLALIQSP